MTELDLLRQGIDQIDRELVDLFLQRMDIACKVGAYKRQNGIPVLDAAREAAVLESKRALAPDEESGREVVALFETLMGLSRARQAHIVPPTCATYDRERLSHKSAQIIFQGESGAYTEEAVLRYFGDPVDITATAKWHEVFDALSNGTADYGVLPIENSTTGAITQVYDLLGEKGCVIVGEVILPVRHCLMGLPGATVEGLSEVFSHPQGFYQCEKYLKNQSFRCTEMGNTALAAQHVAQAGKHTLAAIGSRRAAEVYGLEILAEGINDAMDNQTRFLVIARSEEALITPEADKVSLLFKLPHRSGTLFEVMRIFAEQKLNLLKLESRPIGERPWEYSFFVDIQGNLQTPEMDQALAELKKTALEVRVLGNYKGVLL